MPAFSGGEGGISASASSAKCSLNIQASLIFICALCYTEPYGFSGLHREISPAQGRTDFMAVCIGRSSNVFRTKSAGF